MDDDYFSLGRTEPVAASARLSPTRNDLLGEMRRIVADAD